MAVVSRILVGFTDKKQRTWRGWHSRRQWPPVNQRPRDPNVTYYVADNRTLPGGR